MGLLETLQRMKEQQKILKEGDDEQKKALKKEAQKALEERAKKTKGKRRKAFDELFGGDYE